MAISYKNKWLGGYETLRFDTPDGDMDFGQFAHAEGGGFYVRTRSKSESQFDWVETLDMTGLTEVHVVPGEHCYYDEFLTAKGAEAIWAATPKTMPLGGVLRLPTTGKKYWDCAKIKNHPQPQRSEQVDKLPPPEPKNPPPEHHSIALDAASVSADKSSVSSYTFTHTCTGSNLIIVIGDSHYKSVTDTTVSGITYNGDACTSIRSDVRGNYARSTLYYRIAPDTGGAYTVSVTFSGNADYANGGAISYTGAAQSGQPDAHNGANGTATPASVSVTTVADNCWVCSVVVSYASGLTLTCGNTQRWNNDSFNVLDGGGSDTNGPKTPAGAQTMSWTLSKTTIWAISACSIAPASGDQYTRTINDSLGVTDAQALVRNVLCTFNESMGVSDVPGKIAEAMRVLAEALGLTDSMADTKGQNRTVDDALGLTDALSKDEVKILADSLGLTDVATRICALVRMLADSLGVSDDIAKVWVALRTLADDLGITDVMIEQYVPGGGTPYTETVNDALGITDSSSRLHVILRIISESLGLTDDVVRLFIVSRSISDSLNITDVVLKSEHKTLADALGLTDSISRLNVTLRVIADTLGVTDDMSRVWTALKIIADQLGVTDAMQYESVGNITRIISDALGLTDSTTLIRVVLRVLSENLGLTDSVASLLAVSRIVDDSEGLTDNLILARMMTVADTLGITDSVVKLISYIRTQDDNVGLLDAMVKVAVAMRTINDSMGITDAETHHLGLLIKIAWMMAGNIGALNSTISRN